ncbi:Fc.00g092090.m01.CDS01 [Cosmosporella sp. VM-42]
MASILVTGGNRGIGYAIVQSIAERLPSSTIIIACRDPKAGETAIEQLKANGAKASLDVVQIDIEDDDSIEAAAATVGNKYGKLDVLINNAIKLQFPKSKENLAEVRACSNACFNNGITSNAIVTQAFLPLLRKSDWPRVIMVSSTRGSLGMTVNKQLPPVTLVDYCIAKAGLNMLTLGLQGQEEARDENERVTYWATSPGHCKTAFNGYRGLKDPLEGAEVVLRLLESQKGDIKPGTFWEYENGEFRVPPW